MADNEEAKKIWEKNKDAIRGLVGSQEPPNAADIKTIRKVLDEIDACRGDGRPISSFFEAVGTGIVVAQRQLDDQSYKYNEGKPLVDSDPQREKPEMPTLFRIPRVSAEIQFNIRSASESGFNILIAQSKEEQEQSVQQKVSFEVVAAPPPPRPNNPPPPLGELQTNSLTGNPETDNAGTGAAPPAEGNTAGSDSGSTPPEAETGSEESLPASGDPTFEKLLVTGTDERMPLLNAIRAAAGEEEPSYLKADVNRLLIFRGTSGHMAVFVKPDSKAPEDPAAITVCVLDNTRKVTYGPTQMKKPLSSAAVQLGAFLLGLAKAQAKQLGE